MATTAQPISLWRRLVNWRSNRARTNLDDQTDRRVWVRLPSHVETTCESTAPGNKVRVSARVRDISRGGVNLLVNERFWPGALLSVEIPGPCEKAPSAVLAYIVHVLAQSDGTWSLGCRFARELEDEDLAALDARRQRADAQDQRTWERFPCSVQGTYQLLSDGEPESSPMQVQNISASGVGLLVDRSIEPGTLISLDLHGPTGQGRLSILACVVHVTPRENESWSLGCNFIRELSDQELAALV
jgi:hypothetical protein